MKKGIVLACCAMLLAGQLQSAEALDWNRRIGVDRMIDRTIDNTINRAVNKVEKQEKTRRVIFQNLPQSAAEIGPETDAQQVAAYTVAALARTKPIRQRLLLCSTSCWDQDRYLKEMNSSSQTVSAADSI